MAAVVAPGNATGVPRDFRAFRNLHAGATVLVCGCGDSLNLLDDTAGLVTIGVNDVGRKLTPDYLVVVNPRTQFSAERLAFVEDTRARAVFSHLDDLRLQHSRLVRFRLGTYGGTEPSLSADILHYTQNSPYVAICLAMHFGAARIGLIGVDFTEHHFFARTGSHALAGKLPQIDAEYSRLAQTARARGVEIVNLSPVSRLGAFQKSALAEFRAGASTLSSNAPRAAGRALKIVSYATTPVAGVPAILARCISSQTPHEASCVWATGDYGNGVCFEGGVQWRAEPQAALSKLEEADVVIVHNGKTDARHEALLARKPVVTLAHNYAWNVDLKRVQAGMPGVVVGQYQATLPEFGGWRVVPNPVPLWEPQFQPGLKSAPVRICFTPSAAHERYPPGHRLYWHAKGSNTTLRVLDMLAARQGVTLEALRGRQVSHAEALAMKRRAHIVIDECVTGSYHRNSLEGLAAGCVVVNGVGLLPGVAQVLNQCCFPASEAAPFVRSDLASLAGVLEELVALGPEELARRGRESRAWIERHWGFASQWRECWMPAIEEALEVFNAGVPRKSVPAPCLKPEGLSVVVPHGGLERLPLLAATVAALSQCASVSQLIISECGPEPVARQVAERWGAEYVFTAAAGLFNKSLAINVGSALTRHDTVAWWDNDVLLPESTLVHAVSEMRQIACDVFFPFSRIAYLSESGSMEVRFGTRNAADCAVVTSMEALRKAVGGVVFVRAAFLEQFGGMCEEFQGWGGEDSAWLHKAGILGSVRVTACRTSVAWHLWHPDSGGLGGDPGRRNARYGTNAKLFTAIRALTTRAAILARLPPPSHASAPWGPEVRISFVVPESAEPALHDLAARWQAHLSRLYGTAPEIIAPGAVPESAAPAAFVLFGLEALRGALERLRHCPALVVVPPHSDGVAAKLAGMTRAFAVVPDEETILDLRQQGVRVWHLPWKATGDGVSSDASLLVGALSSAIHVPPCAPEFPPLSAVSEPLTVWMYWEGHCPDWIAACHETVRRHALHVRVLGPTEFDALRDTDRDIDIRQLHVAHRADFIRAWLLARFGGLWVDSDCVVVRSLQPLLDALGDHDFIAHREREGYYSNAFMGARPGSAIARRLYATVAATVRSGRRLAWISIGNQPLTSILEGATERWLELDTELVQPLCWSGPGLFFEQGTPGEHERRSRNGAFCYMLSNQHLQKYQKANPRQRLLDDASFFSFVLRRAQRRAQHPTAEVASLGGEHLVFCTEALAHLAPGVVVEVHPHSTLWEMVVKECSPGASYRAVGAQEMISGSAASSGAGAARESDLAILGETAWDEAAAEPATLRSAALREARHVLVIARLSPRSESPVAAASARARCEDERLRILLGDEAIQWKIFRTAGGRRYVAAVLSAQAGAQRRTADDVEPLFLQMHADHARLGLKTTSGPGSTLEQTAELRQRLPALLQHLGVQSVLDAGCGDFFWQSHCQFGVGCYTGVDVIAALVARLQRDFGNARRSFLVLDARSDPLPRRDLVLCRDYLVHLTYPDIRRTLRQFIDSGAYYLLATTFPTRAANTDIETGGWRALNLCAPPFSLPRPVFLINEKCSEASGAFADKSLGLWRLSDLERHV